MNKIKINPDNKYISLVHKITPTLTLIFIIYSYYNSVKPVFDKTEELNNSKEEIKVLSEQINSKQTELKDFTNQILEAKKNEKELANQISALQLERSELLSQTSKYKSEIEIKEKSILESEKSAVKANLKIIIGDISDEYIKSELSRKAFDIKAYTKQYISEFKSENEYQSKAKEVLESFLNYDGKYNIENSIFYLTYYYEFIYDKK